jgi:hypothetical protein
MISCSLPSTHYRPLTTVHSHNRPLTTVHSHSSRPHHSFSHTLRTSLDVYAITKDQGLRGYRARSASSKAVDTSSTTRILGAATAGAATVANGVGSSSPTRPRRTASRTTPTLHGSSTSPTRNHSGSNHSRSPTRAGSSLDYSGGFNGSGAQRYNGSGAQRYNGSALPYNGSGHRDGSHNGSLNGSYGSGPALNGSALNTSHHRTAHNISADQGSAAAPLPSRALLSTARVNRSHDPESMLRTSNHQLSSRPPLPGGAERGSTISVPQGNARLGLGLGLLNRSS